MAGILVKGLVSYDYEKAVRGSSFIRLYDANGFCFKSFLNISVAGFADYYNYVLTSDTAADSNKIYYVRSGEAGSYTFTNGSWATSAYELLPLAEYEVADVAGAGTVAAESGSITDKKLSLTLPMGIYIQNKLQVNFKTPVDSYDISHIVIDDTEFELVDANAVCVCNYKRAFLANSIVSVILDLEAKKAAVQNLKFGNECDILEIVIPSDGWVDGIYTANDLEGIKEHGIMGLSHTATTDQIKATANANITIASYTDTSLTFVVEGTVPTIDIPINLFFFG